MSAGKAVIVISSHVARGGVGNRAMVFALERLGFTVWAVPTVLLPHHPGHGPAQRIVPEDNAFSALLEALVKDERGGQVAGIVSGYLASTSQAEAVASLVRQVKASRPDALYLCDPVIGDADGLYVGESIAEAVRDQLLPLADAITPNAFECGWLAGEAATGEPDLAALARRLPPPVALVTSAPALMRGQIGTLLTNDDAVLFEHPRIATPIKGTGDLLAALVAARRLEGRSWPEAAELALASVFEVLAGSAKADADELLLPALQTALVQPRARIGTRRIAARRNDRGGRRQSTWVAGVDGCRSGWIAVFLDTTRAEPPRVRLLKHFAELLAAEEAPSRIAVDMPIGLPDRIAGPGRAAEQAVRPLLGMRQSSVFSIPSRAAVMADDYAESCRLALATSTPPRKVSKQGFMLFAKIRELDALLTPELAERVIEVHPEVAFWRLNGEAAMQLPKKVKGRVNPAGMEERRTLLERFGYAPQFLRRTPPKGAGDDDFLDACVAAIIAERHVAGLVRPFPDPPQRDARGLPIAIWA
jgi:pyridoxal kinase